MFTFNLPRFGTKTIFEIVNNITDHSSACMDMPDKVALERLLRARSDFVEMRLSGISIGFEFEQISIHVYTKKTSIASNVALAIGIPIGSIPFKIEGENEDGWRVMGVIDTVRNDSFWKCKDTLLEEEHNNMLRHYME